MEEPIMTRIPIESFRNTVHPLLLAALVIGLAALTGCPADLLPAGWEDAVPASELQIGDLGTTDPDDADVGTAIISGNVDRLEVRYIDSFPCSDELVAYQQIDGTDVDILVQPADLHPDAVTGSDCTFQVDVTVLDLDEGSYHVTVYRRDSDQVDPEMEAIAVAEGDAVLGFSE
jgi:hypothetical protein